MRREESDLKILAERGRRLGLLASMAFAHFAALYRKYNPDQPRDERGRWAETDAGHGTDAEASDVQANEAFVGQRARTGDPKIDSVTEILEQKVVEVLNRMGPGSGPLYGLQVHVEFANAVREANIPNVVVEQPWYLGDPINASILGSIRTDVAMLSDVTGRAIAAWDLKTGQAVLGPSRASDIRNHLQVGREVPVIELHVIRGSTLNQYEIRSVVNGQA